MKVLVSGYTGLGNFILKTPMIHAIKDLWPGAKVDIIAGNNFGTEFVLAGSKYIDETHILKKEAPLSNKIAFFLTLRKKRYDAIFIPFDACPTFMLAGAVLMGGLKVSHISINPHRPLKFRIRDMICLLALPGFRCVPVLQGRHEIDLNYDLLEAFYDRPMERSYRTYISCPEPAPILERFGLARTPYVVVQPTAANGALTSKVWAVKNFEALAEKLLARHPNHRIVLVGDKGDLNSIGQSKLLHMPGVVNIMGQTTISEVCAIIKNAALVVAHDSGIMHIADALNVRLIALLGSTDYTRTRPLGNNSHILYSRNECFAAFYNARADAELAKKYANNYCMSGITVADVMKQIEMVVG